MWSWISLQYMGKEENAVLNVKFKSSNNNKSYQSALRQAESSSGKEGDNKLCKVEHPTVEAQHCPVDAFQVPEIQITNNKVTRYPE